MSDITGLSEEQRQCIARYLPGRDSGTQRPFVTLTYAQSLDSMISLGAGLRTTLSGPESKSMTHYLRLHHDAILIGTGTAKADNPSLNCRYPGATLKEQPQPTIIGSTLPEDWLSKCKATSLAVAGSAKRPWVVCVDDKDDGEAEWRWQDDHLRMKQSADGRMDWDRMLQALADRNIRSIMIEGGASIINDLLRRPNLIDSVIVTIAPTYLGKEGVQVAPVAAIVNGQRQNVATLQQVQWCRFGQDIVLGGRLR